MRDRAGRAAPGGRPGRRGGYALALVAALALVLAAAVPVFATDGGPAPGPKVVGGKAVPDGKYRFMAALELRFRHEGGTTPFQQFCGGTLIDSDHVMTAAHCVEFIGGRRGIPLEDFRVVVGRTVLGSDQGKVRRVGGPEGISIHPDWRPQYSSARDVAVIELARPIYAIKPIEPATAEQDPLEQEGRSATVTGWGITTQQPPNGFNEPVVPRRMREGEVPLVSDDAAREAYGKVFYRPVMVAAGEKGGDTCYGDSGGPLFARDGGRYRQIGITSFGYGCATTRFPGVYTEVNAPKILDFVERETAQD